MSILQKINNRRKIFKGDWRGLITYTLEFALTSLARAILYPLNRDTTNDPHHQIFRNFVATVNALPSARLLEIGSRARSGNIYTQGFRKDIEYVGFDIIPGPNVDIVGDIHQLSKSIPNESFDAIFSISVFEHLAMPWKAALEMNKVLKVGGLVFIATHPTWPLHDRPWDFFRFSTDALRSLFHSHTGFEILEASEGLPCRIIPLAREISMQGMERSKTAFLAISMIAQKTGKPDPRLSWDIELKDFLTTHYPE